MQSFRIRKILAIDYTEATVEWEQWADEDCDSDTGKTMKLQAIRRLNW